MSKFYKIKTVIIPIYTGCLDLIITNDVKKLNKRSGFFNDDFVFAHALSYPIKGVHYDSIVINLHHKNCYIRHSHIAHEALHVTHFIMERHGIEQDFNNPEPENYLMGWVIDEFYRFIKDLKLEKRIKL